MSTALVLEAKHFQMMDRQDEEQIVAHLIGNIERNIAKKLYYNHQGTDCISKVGLDEARRKMEENGYIFKETNCTYSICPLDQEYIVFQALITLHRRTLDGQVLEMGTILGTKRKYLKFKKNNGSIVDDPFWFEKGSQMAIRNAIRRLIPIALQQKIIQEAKARDRGNWKPPQQMQALPKSPPKNVMIGMEKQQQLPSKPKQQAEMTEEEKIQWLIDNQGWLKETFPEKPLVYRAGDNLPIHFDGTWEEMLMDVDRIVTQENGKEKSLRQWLYIRSNYPNHQKPRFPYKCKALATIHKTMEEQEQKQQQQVKKEVAAVN